MTAPSIDEQFEQVVKDLGLAEPKHSYPKDSPLTKTLNVARRNGTPYLPKHARHDVLDTLNLGYYRTEVICSCGRSWWHGEHDEDPSWAEARRAHLIGLDGQPVPR